MWCCALYRLTATPRQERAGHPQMRVCAHPAASLPVPRQNRARTRRRAAECVVVVVVCRTRGALRSWKPSTTAGHRSLSSRDLQLVSCVRRSLGKPSDRLPPPKEWSRLPLGRRPLPRYLGVSPQASSAQTPDVQLTIKTACWFRRPLMQRRHRRRILSCPCVLHADLLSCAPPRP